MKLFKDKTGDSGDLAVAEPPAATRSTKHAAVQADLDDIQRERSRLEEESRILSERLTVIAVQTEEAKVKMATCAGKSGTSALDALDRERLELVRKREGLQILIERLSTRQAPLQARARQLAQIADIQRQDDAVAIFEKNVSCLR